MKKLHTCEKTPCLQCELDKDRDMWMGIRSGLIGLKTAIGFTRHSAAGGIALTALGRMIKAIEDRWQFPSTTSTSAVVESASSYDRSNISV